MTLETLTVSGGTWCRYVYDAEWSETWCSINHTGPGAVASTSHYLSNQWERVAWLSRVARDHKLEPAA